MKFRLGRYPRLLYGAAFICLLFAHHNCALHPVNSAGLSRLSCPGTIQSSKHGDLLCRDSNPLFLTKPWQTRWNRTTIKKMHTIYAPRRPRLLLLRMHFLDGNRLRRLVVSPVGPGFNIECRAYQGMNRKPKPIGQECLQVQTTPQASLLAIPFDTLSRYEQ